MKSPEVDKVGEKRVPDSPDVERYISDENDGCNSQRDCNKSAFRSFLLSNLDDAARYISVDEVLLLLCFCTAAVESSLSLPLSKLMSKQSDIPGNSFNSLYNPLDVANSSGGCIPDT